MPRRKGEVPPGFVKESRGALVPSDAHAGARKCAEELKGLIPEGEGSAVASKLRWSPSRISRIDEYRSPLKVSEVLAICRAVGKHPGEFFMQVFGEPGQQNGGVTPPPSPSPSDLEARIRQLAREEAEATVQGLLHDPAPWINALREVNIEPNPKAEALREQLLPSRKDPKK